MSTKAQLEVEVAKLTEERGSFLRQIKNLKKRKNAQPAPVIKNDTGLETELTNQLVASKKHADELSQMLSSKNRLLEEKEIKVNKFLAMSTFERLFLSKEALKKLF